MQASPLPFVFIVIVNWNGKDLLLECLASLEKQRYPRDRCRVLVVDNASTDGSRFAAAHDYPGAIFLENRENRGYAKAVNQGVEQAMQAGADYIWVLNNDVLVEEEALSTLVRVGESDENIGVVAPVIYAADDNDRVENAGYKINFWIGWLRRLKFDKEVFGDGPVSDVDSVLGCSNLIKASVFSKVGLLRPVYEVYFEETDFNVRARRSGFRVVIARDARVWHKNASTMNKFILRRAYLLLRNLLLFQLLNARPRHLLIFIPYYFLVHLPYFLIRGTIYGLGIKLRQT